MQQGLLFLAGDAAHLITPAGGKGMNLAIQDGIELAHGLIERFGPRQDDTRLSAYSRTRLPSIWQTEAFSNWFLHVLLTSLRDGKEPSGAVPGGFSHGLRHGWIAALQNDPLFARWFAHAYAGVDLISSPRASTATSTRACRSWSAGHHVGSLADHNRLSGLQSTYWPEPPAAMSSRMRAGGRCCS